MSHTEGNKKTHLTILETCIFRVYLRNHLSYKKVVKIYLHSRLKSLQMKKRIFQIWSQNHLIFSKTLFCQKKVSYWKKSAILKNSKTIFHGSKVQELNLHTNKFPNQKPSRKLFKSGQMCLPYFCELNFHQLS